LSIRRQSGISYAFSSDMFKTRCPHCGVKLGDFLYADTCPRCHDVIEHNLGEQTPVHVKVARARLWPVRVFFGLVHLVES
jgi:hypothetical protein